MKFRDVNMNRHNDVIITLGDPLPLPYKVEAPVITSESLYTQATSTNVPQQATVNHHPANTTSVHAAKLRHSDRLNSPPFITLRRPKPLRRHDIIYSIESKLHDLKLRENKLNHHDLMVLKEIQYNLDETLDRLNNEVSEVPDISDHQHDDSNHQFEEIDRITPLNEGQESILEELNKLQHHEQELINLKRQLGIDSSISSVPEDEHHHDDVTSSINLQSVKHSVKETI